MKNNDKWGKCLRSVAELSTIPMVMIAGPLLGYFCGYYIDEWFGTKPFGLIVFIILGLVAAFKQVFFMIRKYDNDDNK